MASGSQITLNGGVTMTQVVVGDLIDDQDYNNMRDNVNRLIGVPLSPDVQGFNSSTTYGINQGIVDVDAAVEGTVIFAQSQAGAIKDLQDDLQALCSFYGVTFRNGVDTDKTSSDSITAEFMNNIMLNIEDCWNTRFSPALRSQTSTKAYTVADFTWVNSIGFNFAFEWPNVTKCRAFFNAGGAVYVSSTIGLFELDYIDFYSLTTDDILIGSQTAGGVTLDVYAKIDATNPAKIIIETVHSALTNQSGTLTFNSYAQTPQSNGSGFIFDEPVNTTAGVPASTSFFMNGPADADEGDTFTITLNTAGVADGSFPFTINGVTANDISPFTGNFTTINGEATVQFTVSQDQVTEGPETAIILLDNGEASISVNIGDTSIRPPEASSITAPATVSETDSFTFSIQIDNPESETYTWTVSGSNSPTPSSGVFPSSGVIVPTSGPGQTFTFTSPSISLTEDPDENAGSLTITVDTADNASATVAVTDITITETILSVVASPSTLSESGTRTATVTVTTANVTDNTILNWSVNLLSAQSGDFADPPGTSGTVEIISNEGQFDVTIVDDVTTESDETFSVSVSGPAVNNSVTSNVVTISANDAPALTSIVLPTSTVYEGDTLQVTVNMEYVPNGTVLTWSLITDGTNGTTSSSADFVETTGTESVSNNQIQFNVQIEDDVLEEFAETFQINVSGSALGYSLDATTTDITIAASDIVIPTIDSVTRNITTVNEGGTVTFTVNTSNFPAGNTVLNWAVNNIGTVNADFVATSGTVTIDGGVGSNTFDVSIFNDALEEPNETFTVTVSGTADGEAVSGTSGNVTIAANDVLAYTLSLPTSVTEGNTLTLSLAAQNPTGEVVNWTLDSGDTYNRAAAASGTFGAVSGTTDTSTVSIDFDGIRRGSETWTFTATGQTSGRSSTATVSVLDAPQGTGLSVVSSPIDEGDTAQFFATTTNPISTSNWDYIILQTGSAQHVTQTQLNSSPAITWAYSSVNDRYEANISVPTQIDRASASGGQVGVRLRYNGTQVGSAVYVAVNNTIAISYALDDETNNDTEITEGTTRDFDIVVTNPYPAGETLSWQVIPPGEVDGSDQAAYDQVSTNTRSGTTSYGAGQSTASFSVTTVYDSEYTGSTVLPIGTLRLKVTGQSSGVSSNVDVIDLINARADLTITSVSPSTITEGESFTVTVEGENIQGGEILRVNSGTGVYTSGADVNGVEDFNLSFGAYNSSTGKYTATITVNTIIDSSVTTQDTIALSVINNANQNKDTASVTVNNAVTVSEWPSEPLSGWGAISITRSTNSNDYLAQAGTTLSVLHEPDNDRIKITGYVSTNASSAVLKIGYITYSGYSNPTVEVRFYESNVQITSVGDTESFTPSSSGNRQTGTWYSANTPVQFGWRAEELRYTTFPQGQGGGAGTSVATVDADNVYFQVKISEAGSETIVTSPVKVVDLSADFFTGNFD